MTQEPKRRSRLRSRLGKTYYGALRRLWWLKMRRHFAKERRGYQEGMVLHNGQITAGTGGGLCQLSSLIYWMALHSPLTVVERGHEMRGEYWGGYTRRNKLIRQVYSLTGELLHEELAAENCAITMYSPMLTETS